MKPLLNYDGLAEYMIKISARPNDTDLQDQIPNFILLAQINLSRRLNIFGTQRIFISTLPNMANTITVPNNYIRSISLTLFDPRNSGQPHVLKFRTPEYITVLGQSSNFIDIPTDYCELDINNLFIAPTPVDVTPYEGFGIQLIYHELYQPLTPQTQTNYFTQRLMDVLVSASLYQMYIFLKDSYYIEFYRNEMESGIATALQVDSMNKSDRSSNAEIN